MKIKFSSRTHMTTSSLSTQKQVNDNAKKKKKTDKDFIVV